MKRYIQVYGLHMMKQADGQYQAEWREELGSEGTVPLDGRLGIDRMMNEAIDYIGSYQHIKPYIQGFKIYDKGRCIKTYQLETTRAWYEAKKLREWAE